MGNANVAIWIIEEIFFEYNIYVLCLYDEWLYFVYKDVVCSICRLYD